MNTKKLTVLMCGALALAGPAGAQSGFEAAQVELRYQHNDFESAPGFGAGGQQSYGVLSGSFSYLLTETVGFQLGAGALIDDSDIGFETYTYSAEAHVFFDASEHLRLGVMFAYADFDDFAAEDTFALEGIYYKDGLRVEVGVSQTDVDGTDLDAIAIGLEYEFGDGWVGLFNANYDSLGEDTDNKFVGIGIGYDIGENNRVYASIGQSKLNSFGSDQDTNRFEIGYRYNFGGRLKREKAVSLVQAAHLLSRLL